MKVKLFIVSLILIVTNCFSQTEKPINGIVVCDDIPVQGIEVINLTTEKTTITNAGGTFSIGAKATDLLVFVSKNHYYKRISLEKEDIKKSTLKVTLTQKPEELEEVLITKPNFKPQGLFSQEVADEIQLEKGLNRNRQVYDGTIENGADLKRIGGMILDLFIKKKETNKNSDVKVEFKELATTSYEEDFFVNTLKLKPDEIALFLEFCDADPNSKKVLENTNPLKIMDYLITKNIEFKKLPSGEKK
jgi:hypothetical protein